MTSTIKGAVVWDIKFILAYGLKLKATGKTQRSLRTEFFGVKKQHDCYSISSSIKSQMDTGYDKKHVVASHFFTGLFN
jgi:hypothetical protein